jgi:hypothetical protein
VTQVLRVAVEHVALVLREVVELLRCFGQVIDVYRQLLHGSRLVAGASIVAIERSAELHFRSQSLGGKPSPICALRPRRRGPETVRA